MTFQRTSLSVTDDDLLDTVHLKAYPIDTHLDTLYLTRVGGYDFWKGDWKTKHEPFSIKIIKKITPKGKNSPHCEHVSGQDFIRGGYGGACFSAHALWENLISLPFADPWKHWQDHRHYVGRIAAESGGALRLTATPDEVRRARDEGVASAILSVEGAHILGASGRRTEALRLSRLEQIAAEGAAYITFNHFSHTDICEAGFQPMNPWRRVRGGGLSAFGRRFVHRCIDLGLMVDVSHSRSEAVIEIAGICKARGAPLLASHGAARSISTAGQVSRSKHLARTFSNDAVRAIVETGGTISIILSPYYLKDARLPDGSPDRDADIAFVVNYYERLAQLITSMDVTDDAWNHLSFGSDFDGGISSIPTGMKTGADLRNLTRAMLDAGWPEERIYKVYSGNFLRVWDATTLAAGAA
ncbi:peptidase [Agrobacterium rubi]|uniref:membrane dipeptidase n=1 Tax=Agrobacterium rubi TaxID=28099 RepID=UPI001574508E|nr:membrane dipeptidase [Agrobacterium rubi]NTF07504.1 peptidase [Agrobacterium rubi]NTF19880.1 peptidase [Agrobacterium rubi]NTF26845.1 peptidase [Agrobacterium rubi]